MRKFFLAILLTASAAMLAGCFPPTTSHPIGASIGLRPDSSLIGLWRGQMATSEDGRPVYFHFLSNSDRTMTIVMVQGGAEPDGDWMTASATTAELGENRFLNARMRFSEKGEDTGDGTRGTIPLFYSAEAPGRISFFMLDEDATKAAIKARKIAGSIDPGTAGDAKITADPAALDKFFSEKAGITLFSKRFATLTKME